MSQSSESNQGSVEPTVQPPPRGSSCRAASASTEPSDKPTPNSMEESQNVNNTGDKTRATSIQHDRPFEAHVAVEANTANKKPVAPYRRSKTKTSTTTQDDTAPNIEARRLYTLSKVFVRSASTQGLVRPEAFGEMNIFKTPGENGEDLVFLMVDDFSYPLVGQPIMNCGLDEENHRTYILPADHQHSFHLQLNERTSSVKVKQLEFFLRSYATLRDREEGPIEVPAEIREEARAAATSSSVSGTTEDEEAGNWTDYFVSALTSASKATASGIVTSADYTSRAISWAGEYLRNQTTRCDMDLTVSETTKSHLTTARAISTSAVAVSAGLVRGVSYVATTLGKQLSGAVAQTEYGKQWNAAASTSTGRSMRKIGAASLVAFAELWEAMETGIKRVGSTTACATTEYVKHRYGSDYAAAANEGLTAAGNSALAMYHLKGVGWSSLARRTLAQTASSTVGLDETGQNEGKSEDPSESQDTNENENSKGWFDVLPTGVFDWWSSSSAATTTTTDTTSGESQ